MENEKMGEILAEAMGWRKMQLEIAPGVRAMYWVDANGKAIVLAKSWKPWDSWPQCGMVIEAMRDKGWCIALHDDMMSYYGRWHHMDMNGDDSPMTYETTFCKWVTLSAARALEATDGE